MYKEALSNPIAIVKGIRNSNNFDYEHGLRMTQKGKVLEP